MAVLLLIHFCHMASQGIPEHLHPKGITLWECTLTLVGFTCHSGLCRAVLGLCTCSLVKAIELLGSCQRSCELAPFRLFQTITQRVSLKATKCLCFNCPDGHTSKRQRVYPLQGSFTGVWISCTKTCYKRSCLLCFLFFCNPLLACFCGTKLSMGENTSGALHMQSPRCQRRGVLCQPAPSLLQRSSRRRKVREALYLVFSVVRA